MRHASVLLGSIALGAAVITAVIIGTFASQPASSAAPSLGDSGPPGPPRVAREPASSPAPSIRKDRGGAGSEEDGALPHGVTAFDHEHPGVANVDPDLLQALREATTDAAEAGIDIYLNSGWRSPEYQQRLLREAVARYGSEKEAARWVATPDTSPHVSGDAVDIGPSDAAAWLSKYGARFGLCQIYRNEPWHFELRPDAVDHGCPRVYRDPAHDPRMQG